MPADTCFFDGACGMCRRTVRILRRFDWLSRLEFADLTTTPPDQLPVDPLLAMRGMPMRTRDGRTLVGFPAVRRALLQTPVGFLPALLLYLPGVSHLGRRVYNSIAASRARDVCDVTKPSNNPSA
jgi:predicted DCC family thiol-disulfide oxidoreductase YuxK